MAGAPLSFPAQYPNVYAYGKEHSLQVLPDAIAPTYAAELALARRGRLTRTPIHSTPLSVADNAKSENARALRQQRKEGHPYCLRGGWASAGYGTPTGTV